MKASNPAPGGAVSGRPSQMAPRTLRWLTVCAVALAGCARGTQQASPPSSPGATGPVAKDSALDRQPKAEPPPPAFPAPPPRIEPPIRSPRAEAPVGLRELFPGVRADVAARLVEFDGTVPINCHDPVSPDVYLEVTACTPDTKEHEALVMTRVRPSHVHAALLAIGLKPGKPGSWRLEGRTLVAVPPEGAPVEVTIAYEDKPGHEVEAPASAWVKVAGTGGAFAPKRPGPRWVFAGSEFRVREGREVYEADGAGTLIGLTTFGSETIAWADTLSPESSVQDPEWLADPAKVPAAGTKVVVRIRPTAESK